MAPTALAERVHAYAVAATTAPVAGGAQGADTLAERLAHAARQALGKVAEHPGDRSAALDLLAADALITLALLKQSLDDAGGLHAFATRLLEAEFGHE